MSRDCDAGRAYRHYAREGKMKTKTAKPEPIESGELLSADVLRKIAEKHNGIADNPTLVATLFELHPDALVLASVICLHDANDCNKEIQLCSQGL